MPPVSEFNATLLKELEDCFQEIRKQKQALEANKKGLTDIVHQLERGAPMGELGYQAVQIKMEMEHREHELKKLEERRLLLLQRIPFFQLTGDQ